MRVKMAAIPVLVIALLGASKIDAQPIAYNICYPVTPVNPPEHETCTTNLPPVTVNCPVNEPSNPIVSPEAFVNKQCFKEHNSELGFHLGDDWNGTGGGNSDKGAPVYAVADGEVVFIEDLGNGEPHKWGKVLVLAHRLTNDEKFYSLYAHLEEFHISPLCTTTSSPYCIVRQGDQVGTLGDANGFYTAHLHFEIRKNLTCFDVRKGANCIPGPGYVQSETDKFIDDNYHSPTEFIEHWRGGQCVSSSAISSMAITASSCAPPAQPPSVETLEVSGPGTTYATLHLAVNPNYYSTRVWFQWGSAETDVSTKTPDLDVGSGSSTLTRSWTITSLTCDTRYYFQAWADGYDQPVSGEVLTFRTGACSPDLSELIDNGNFANGTEDWITTGYFQADDRFAAHRSDPGYAYLAQFSGDWGNNIAGTLHQDVTIPADADSASLEYWYWIATRESVSSPPRDVLTASIRDTDDDILLSLDAYTNDDADSFYRRARFDFDDFIGETFRVHFIGTTSSTYPTVFRIDDVSLTVTYDDGGETQGFDLAAFNPSVDEPNPSLGSKVRFSLSTTNLGDTGAPDNVVVTYYLDGVKVGQDIEETALEPGETDGEAESFVVPETPGNYSAYACLDIYPEEVDTSNNCTAEIILDVAEDPTEGPDLIIVSTETSHTTVEPSQQFEMSAIIRNDGNKSFSDNNLVRFVVTRDGELDDEDWMIGSDGVTWLSVGQERTASDTVTAPDETGTFLAGACAVERNAEIDRTNNCSPDPFTLHVIASGCQPETLSLSGMTVFGTERYEACQSIDVGPATTVEAGGELMLEAPIVVLHDGFRVNNGGSLRVSTGQSALFEDDFDDGEIDSQKWTYEGNTVTETGGELHLDRLVTDDGGAARTLPITIDPIKVLTVSRKVKVGYANDKFGGSVAFDWPESPDYRFAVNYSHYFYDSGQECTTDGFSITRNNANAHQCPERDEDGTARIPGVWDTWFDEKVVYDPVTGELDYFINGIQEFDYNVGPIPSGVDELILNFSTWGWHTGHYQYMDDLVVTQP